MGTCLTLTRNLLILLMISFAGISAVHAQLNMDFRIVSVSSDVDDMDPAGTGFNGGASDPRWVCTITDVPFGTSGTADTTIQNVNCPGTVAWTKPIFSQVYPAGCNTPTDYTLELSAADGDVNPAAPLTLGGALASATFNIPALSLTYPSGGWQPLGTYSITAAGTDCGATGTVTWTFQIEYMTVGQTEYIPPVATCLPSTVTQNVVPGTCSAVVNGISPVAVTDNCGVASQTWIFSGATVDTSATTGFNDASGQTFNAGVTTVTYTVQDYSSNSASCSFTVTVIDNEIPTITCPPNVVQAGGLSCDTTVIGLTPVVMDNCPPAVQVWSMTGATTGNSPGSGINDVSGQTFNPGVTTVTYDIKDPSSNSATCSFTVEIIDLTNPTITCPSDITVNSTLGLCTQLVVFTAPVGTDDCSSASTTMTSGQLSATLFPAGTTVQTYQVTDGAGNTASCSFNITVNDGQNPNINCPSNITVGNDAGACNAVVTYGTPVATDNCPGVNTVMTAGLASGSTFPIGTTVVTYQGTDAAGNTDQCSFNVTVNDTENPVITCPGNITQANDAGLCNAVVNFVAPVGIDNCASSTSLITILGPGATFPIGSTVVTYEVVDASGNTAQCSFDVTVTDSELPVINCPVNITAVNNNGLCGRTLTYATPVGTDNCPGASTVMTTGLASASFFPVGTTTVTYQVSDAAGNTAQCSFDVTVNDTQLPTVSCPANITLSNDPGSCGAIATFATPSAADNCPGTTVAMTAGLASGTLFPIGTTAVTFQATDASGNIATCSFDVTVNDTELPTITCPADITLSVDTGVCGAVVNYTPPVGTDNCPGAITAMTTGQASGTVFPVGTTVITYQVTDASGNVASCSFNVTVNDDELPAIACPGNITQSNDAGLCSAVVNFVAPVGTDNCPGSVTSLITILGPGATFPLGSTVVTYEVVDATGNSAQCSFDVIVNDTELPAIACPANISQSNDAGTCGAVVSYGAPVGTDNCPGVSTIMTAGLASGSLFPIGVTTITYEATDAAGNTNQCSFDVTVNDTEFPIIACPGNIVVSNDAGACGAIVNYASGAADNCPGVVNVMTSGLASGSLFPIGTTTVTFQATDASGNVATCSFDVIVNDTELPIISCPADITLSADAGVCGALVNYVAPVGTDNCSGAVTALTAGQASGTTFPVGTTVVTYTVTDASGNLASCSFNVTINDDELPVITCPGNITQSNDAGLCSAVVNFVAPVGTDNCPGSVTSLITILGPGATFPIGSTVVTYEVVDASGNTAQCSFDVTVNDAELPVISCPSNVNVSNDVGVCGATITYATPVGTDNCTGATTVMTTGQASGTLFPIGTTTVTYEVSDASGNTAQCSFDATVNDTQFPVLTCPADITVSNGANTCGAIVTYTAPVGTDNCPGVTTTMTAGQASGTLFPIGTTTVTYQATDAAGNVTICSFNVTVNDTQAPTVNCPADITLSVDSGVCGALVNYVTPTGTDNCPGVVTIMTSGQASGTVFPVGTTIVTYSGVDASGNITNCSFNVIIIDDEPPVIVCPGNITQSNDAGLCSAIVNFAAPVGTDNCSGSVTSLITVLGPGGTFPIGSTVVTYEVVDASGNTAQCSFDVTVSDTELPVISCPSNVTVSNNAGVCGATITYATPVGTDNCAGASTVMTAGQASATLFPIGTTTVTYQVSDASGNTAQCSFDVTVNDTELPIIACPSNIVVSNDPGVCGAIVNYASGAADNCPGVVNVMTAGQASGTLFPIGTTTVSFQATDASGNVATCSFDVTVNDTDVPTITCPADLTIPNDAGTCDATVFYVAPIGLDNCPGSVTSLIAGLSSGSVFTAGTTVVTYQVADASGNTAQCSFNITITDTESPTITCPAPITQGNDVGLCGGTVNYTAPVVADNCPGTTLTLLAGQASGTLFPIGTTTVTYEVADIAGNTAQCSFNVTVNDTENPTIACPSNVVTGNDAGTCGAVVNYSAPVGTDNCPGSATSLFSGLPTGSTFPIGSTTITYEVVDASGNTAQCSFDIFIGDIETPTITCPANMSVSNDVGTCGAIVNYLSPVGIDNCPGVTTTMTAGQASGTLFPLGTTVITLQVTDASSNTAQCSFNITVTDTENPTVTCPANSSVNNDPGLCGAAITYANPVISDNCPGSIILLLTGQSSGTIFPIGTTTTTYQVTDASGNTAQCTFDITVTDNENPTITCPANITQSNNPGVCGSVVNYFAPNGIDNCLGSVTSLISGPTTGSLFPIGVSTITYQVTDVVGNTAQCSFDITINDTEVPTITCPANISVGNTVGSCDAVVTYAAPVVTDNCTGATSSLLSGLASGSTFPIGVSTVTFEAVDASGNTAQCSFDVTVTDTQNPAILCPTDMTVSNDVGSCDAVVTYGTPVGTDNCPGAATNLISGLASGSTFPIGVNTVTYQVIDAGGNTAQCSFDITVNDVEVPTITCPANMTVANDAGVCGAIVNFVAPVGVDNCPGASTSLITILGPGASFPIGSTVVTYEVSDAGGNTVQCSFDVTVNDTEVPVITCPSNMTVNNDPGVCGANVTYGAPVTSDNCGIGATSIISGAASGSLFAIGASTVTYETVDIHGNTAQCSFDITVNDTENPAITCPSNMIVNNDPGLCGATVTYAVPVGTDNCAGSTTTLLAGQVSGTQFPIGTTTVQYQATDLAGNTAQCSFDVICSDNEAPAITCPVDQVIGNDAGLCSAVTTYGAPVVSDNCPGTVVSLVSGLPSGSIFPIGANNVTFQVVDAGGNVAQCTFVITVNDTEAPSVVCPSNITASNTPGSCDAVVTYGNPVVTDNCTSTSFMLISGPVSGSTFALGTMTIIFEGTDANGNTAQCTFDITVNDTELPTINCPANISTTNDPGTCGKDVTYAVPVGLDNCPGAVTTLIAGLPSPSNFPGGITTVTYEVVDAGGNTAQCSFDVNVVDTQVPIATCPPSITVPNTAGVCSAIVTYAPPTVNDNCPGATINVLTGLPSGSLFPVGTTTNWLEVVDVSGNTAQCSFDVVVVDVEAPNITCPPNQVVSANANCEFPLADYTVMASVIDNCGSFTLSQSPAAGTTQSTGVIVTLYATDQYGNIDSCNFQVTAIDNTAPILNCPTTYTDYFSLTCDLPLPDYVSLLTITENCGTYTYMQTPAPGTVIYADTLITFDVVDVAGNASTCSFNLTVSDSTSPIVTCPQDLEVYFSSICDFVIQDYSGLISTYDNCGPVTLSQNPAPGFAITGNYNVVMTGADVNGNTTQCLFTVIPKDTVPPMLACPPAQTVYVNNTCEAVLPDFTPLAVIISTCETIPVLQTPVPGTVVSNGLTVSFSGTDVSGNTNICTFNVTLIDTISPAIICPADVYSCDSIVDYVPPTATDNCGVLSIVRIAGPAPGTAFPPGQTTITYEATDLSGNTSTCSFVANVLAVPNLSAVATPISCTGEIDGSINVTVTDGSVPFTFNWSNSATTEDISGLSQGSYTCVIVDKYGCSDTLTDSIVEPPLLEVTYTTVLSGCNGFTDGYIKLGVVGGSPSYTFIWSPAVGTGTTASNLPPGDYSISVVDLHGCAVDTTFTVFEADTIAIDGTISVYEDPWNISEEGASDGWIELTTTGGIPPYNYYWDNGEITDYLEDIPAGVYTVYVTDDGGCEGTATFILLEEKPLLAVSGMSPNGDGMNDFFVIRNSEFFPNNELLIMNRWGDVVYKKSGYANEFDGKGNVGMVFYGKELPEGSYFYIFNPGDEDYEEMRGYLIINR